MRAAARLRALERQQRARQGQCLPIAILHPSMIDALGFTDEERRRLVRSATGQELEEWAQLRQRYGSQ